MTSGIDRPILIQQNHIAMFGDRQSVRQFLFDARPVDMGNALPGGNAVAFDWRLLAGRRFPRPWMLAGGLTPENVAEAIRISGATMVDVSSGVEDRPGVKSAEKIAAFCANIRDYRA